MPSGIEVKAAVKKASTWGTAVACGANDGVLLIGDSLKKTIANVVDDSLGLAFIEQRDLGEIRVEGNLSAFLRYDSLDVLLALAMGDTQAPTQQGVTTAYANSIKLKDNVDALFASIAINKAVNIFEYPSAKIAGFTIKGEMGKPLEIEFNVMCNDEVINSSTNTLTTFNNVTYFEKANRTLFSQGVFRMNDQSGAALGGGDKIYPQSFELTFKRKLKGEYVAEGANKIDEPTNDGLPECTLKLAFPRYSSAVYLTNLGSDTRKKMDMVFTGANIAETYNRTFKLSLPHMALVNAEAATQKGQIVHPLEFTCLAASSAPAGMTGITKPFQVDVINKRSTNPLA